MIWSHFDLYAQVPVEPVSAAASVVDVPLPPPPGSVLDSAAEVVSADPTPVLMQPLIEQVVDAAPTAAEVLQVAATEQSLAELGLAGYTPVGLIQNLLEFMHVDVGLPWWGAIVVGQQTPEAYSWRTFLSLWLWFFCSSLSLVQEQCWLVWLCFQSLWRVRGKQPSSTMFCLKWPNWQTRWMKPNRAEINLNVKTNETPFLPDYFSFAAVYISQAAVLCSSWQSLLWPDVVPEETWCESSPWVPGSSSTGLFIMILFCHMTHKIQ